MKDVLLFLHPTFGVLGLLAAVWVFVEALNATGGNHRRLWLASLAVAACFVLAWLLGGWYYVVFYHTDKALILKGPYPWAHSFFMETKEHLFFIPLILALYLPLVARLKVSADPASTLTETDPVALRKTDPPIAQWMTAGGVARGARGRQSWSGSPSNRTATGGGPMSGTDQSGAGPSVGASGASKDSRARGRVMQ